MSVVRNEHPGRLAVQSIAGGPKLKSLMSGVIAILTLLLLFIALPSSASGEVFVYGCVLNGDQEVPATTTSGLGGGQFRIDTSTNTVSYRISLAGLIGTETTAHIHGAAPAGVNSGALTVLPVGNPKVGTWIYSDTQEADILAGNTYVNIHSTVFPGGEVRGQIVPLNAVLDEGQEVPPSGSPARGWATFTIETGANKLHYYISYGGLLGAEVGAHIHGFGGIGVNAPVLHVLPAGSPKIGSWDYAETDEADILAGNAYVNIHSAAVAGGEIRGQICPIVIPIDGAQEVPPTGSTAGGFGLICLDKANNLLGYDIRYAGLVGAETVAHIHGFAPAGANAGVQTALPLGFRKLGVWSYPAVDETNILGGLTYINIHSTAFGGGEIRGQVDFLEYPSTTSTPDPTFASAFMVSESYPNPSGASTTLRFQLEQATDLRVKIFDSQGRLIKALHSGSLPAGEHRVPWDGRNASGVPVPSGVYHYLLESAENRASGRIMIVR